MENDEEKQTSYVYSSAETQFLEIFSGAVKIEGGYCISLQHRWRFPLQIPVFPSARLTHLMKTRQWAVEGACCFFFEKVDARLFPEPDFFN